MSEKLSGPRGRLSFGGAQGVGDVGFYAGDSRNLSIQWRPCGI